MKQKCTSFFKKGAWSIDGCQVRNWQVTRGGYSNPRLPCPNVTTWLVWLPPSGTTTPIGQSQGSSIYRPLFFTLRQWYVYWLFQVSGICLDNCVHWVIHTGLAFVTKNYWVQFTTSPITWQVGRDRQRFQLLAVAFTWTNWEYDFRTACEYCV